MSSENEHLENLSEIRSLMERSSRFISLSGLSGVFAGVFALIGTIAAYAHLNLGITSPGYYEYARTSGGEVNKDFYSFFFTDTICMLVASLALAIMLTARNAKHKGQQAWNAAAKRLVINMLIPLVTGGLFCLVLLFHRSVELVPPAMLVFYGLSLLNASKYTLNDIRYLGIGEIILGLIASLYTGYGLIFWALGFGVLHIIYGIVMYRKYER